MAEEEREISIQDLELALEVYEIESEQKLEQLKALFKEKGSLDLAKMFYEERSSIEIRFQNIITDLIEFLVKQEVPTTDKIRKTFYRILQNPLLLLFKVSRFEIFNLRFDGFDIELEPIDAIEQLSKALYLNIDEYLSITANQFEPYDGKQYKNLEAFLEQATINKIQDKIFVFYNYLRKGAKLFKKNFENKAKIVDIFTKVQSKLLPVVLKREDAKTIKQLSVLNYEIYELEPSFEVLYFFINIPLLEKYRQCFQELEVLAGKAKQASNYNTFIMLFIKHEKQILEKLNGQQVDPCYRPFIENALKSILEMWGCRICYYREFCQLFTALFRLHPKKIEALELTLKHNPNLTKDEIVLLRINFKLEIENKHHELLTLLKSMSLEEVNELLNNFYHRTLYNMSFKEIEREKIINLLSLMNGNSSLAQLFAISERAFKEWNHSIDFTHPHKFIQTEFSVPQIGEQKLKESLVLLTNLCAMEEKGFNSQYATLIKAGTIGKALLQFVKFLQQDEKCVSVLSWPQTHNFIVEAFCFLRKGLNPSTETENLVTVFSAVLCKLDTQQQRLLLQEGLIQAIQDNVETFHIEDCLNCFKKYQSRDMRKILNIFMSGVSENNELVRKFGYLEEKVEDLSKLTLPEDHAEFIVSKYRINNGVVVFKDPGIFNISDLQVLTIPSQIDKVIDNFYFTLDSNAKKFIEHLVQTWNTKRVAKSSELPFYSQLVKSLIELYPIAVPLLSSVRLEDQGGTRRFIQLLSTEVCGDGTYSQIIIGIIKCKCIRYKNGRDYVQEEVIPMAMKEILRNINAGKNSCADKFYVLAQLMKRANLSQIKMQTIQRSIEKIRYELTRCTEPIEAEKYSRAFQILMKQFFLKKQIEMRKEGLGAGYDQLVWSDVRNYVSNLSQNISGLKDEPITEYIVISPFTITQEFNISDYKLKKSNQKKNNPETLVLMSEVLKRLPVFENPGANPSFFNKKEDKKKKLELANLKYDLSVYLGKQNIVALTQKQNVEFVLNGEARLQQQGTDKKGEDNSSFIQYYMKSMAMPSINHKIILANVGELLEANQLSISFLWTNTKNLQNYFVNLLSIFEFAALDAQKRAPQNNPEIQRIVSLVNVDSLGVMKKILKIFGDLGYSNIWAESFDMFWNNFPIRKFLGFNTKSEEAFLSIILKNTLQRQELRQDLTCFLGRLFETRSDQSALMYKVTMDKSLMNTIMKSLSIPHLEKVSLMFHSNFNNLRLYTEQLHEGLKALNIASKNRAYNEYIKISKSVEDDEFSGPLKLFKENFSFFIRIEKEGYKFKKNEETNLALARLSSVLRNAGENQNISGKVNQLLEEYVKQISQLQLAIANRVKSFYLVTKLRDLSFQNALMIPIVHEVMHNAGHSESAILEEIGKLQLFSLMSRLYNQLVRYEDDWRNLQKYSSKHRVDGYVLENQLTLCSTRRFSHSMSKIYQKCDLEFDQVMQRCVDALKVFFGTEVGRKWAHSLDVYPAFLVKSFIDNGKANQLCQRIHAKMIQNSTTYQFSVTETELVETLIKGFRLAPRSSFVNNGISIIYSNAKRSPVDMLKPLQERLLNNQTFVTLKGSGNIIFNKFKSSEATLEEIEILGFIIAYALLNRLPLGINLHPSIVCALSFNIAQLDYLLDVDFKVWEELRNILSVEDSAQLALNFSYNFESLDNFKPIRIELLDKGSSKKVNNLNREEYCDLVCCYILYEYFRPQVNRLLTAILSIVPKQLISCMPTKQILDMFYTKEKSQKILDDYMKKIGVVLPETLIDEKGKRIQNLKDFQNVHWLQDLILESSQLRTKYWRDEQNLFVVTTISGQPSIRVVNGKFLVSHFGSKEEMRQALSKL